MGVRNEIEIEILPALAPVSLQTGSLGFLEEISTIFMHRNIQRDNMKRTFTAPFKRIRSFNKSNIPLTMSVRCDTSSVLPSVEGGSIGDW